jgi:hypothetical protein
VKGPDQIARGQLGKSGDDRFGDGCIGGEFVLSAARVLQAQAQIRESRAL